MKSVLDQHRLPMPIAEMGPWHFWAAPDAVGLSQEDADAIRDGTATAAQAGRAADAAQAAMNALIRAPINDSLMTPSLGRPS